MKQKILAGKYVRALVDSLKADERESVLKALHSFLDGVVSDKKALAFFKSPIIEESKKQEVVSNILKELDVSPKVDLFLKLIINKQRESLFGVIKEHVRTELNKVLGQIDVDIILPEKVEDSAEQDLARSFQKLTDKKIIPSFIHDPEMLGGFMVKLENKLYDGSVRNALRKVADSIAANKD
jgi:F-type H+-transporting ATPase subunit delta